MASLYRRFQAIFGWMLIAVGLVVLPLPIPLGAIMIVIGIAMVSPSSPMMRDVLRNVRVRFPSFSATLDGWAPRMPALIRILIEDTRPPLPDPAPHPDPAVLPNPASSNAPATVDLQEPEAPGQEPRDPVDK